MHPEISSPAPIRAFILLLSVLITLVLSMLMFYGTEGVALASLTFGVLIRRYLSPYVAALGILLLMYLTFVLVGISKLITMPVVYWQACLVNMVIFYVVGVAMCAAIIRMLKPAQTT